MFLGFDFLCENLKAKDKAKLNKATTDVIYRAQLFNSIIGMIDYDNVPDGLEPRFIEMYKLIWGMCGIAKNKDGKLTAFVGGHSDTVNSYGLCTHFIGSDPANNSYDFEIGVDGVVAWNNKLGVSDIEHINQIAGMLTELKTSLDYNIMYARYNPLISVKDSKTKTAIDTALQNTRDGVPTTFLSNISMELNELGVKDIELINICDVKNSDKLQYLYKAVDDTMRNFYNVYGISLSTTSKMAQQSTQEINQTTGLAMLYPIERLKCAKEMCDEVNRIFGTNMTCHFSEVWQIEYQKYVNSVNKVCDDDHTDEQNENEEREEENDGNVEEPDNKNE